MKCNATGLAIIKKAETLRLRAYRCPKGKWTIGWGHTGPIAREGMKITPEQAEQLFRADVARFEREVASLLRVPVTEGQFSALVSFAFNCGSDIDADTIAEGLGDSTLLKKLNAGDVAGAADEFPKWVKCNGEVLGGLAERRKAERALFLGSAGT